MFWNYTVHGILLQPASFWLRKTWLHLVTRTHHETVTNRLNTSQSFGATILGMKHFQIQIPHFGFFEGIIFCLLHQKTLVLAWTLQWHHLTSVVVLTKLSCTQTCFFSFVKILSYTIHPWHPIWHKARTKPRQVIKASTSNNLHLLTSIVFF